MKMVWQVKMDLFLLLGLSFSVTISFWITTIPLSISVGKHVWLAGEFSWLDGVPG